MPHDASEASESHSRHIKYTMPRTQLANLISQTDPNPQIIPSTSLRPSKPTISSILSVGESVHPSLNTSNNKKKKTGFSASTFRGFGCTAAASRQVSLPAVIRTSADWQQSKGRKKKSNVANNHIISGQIVLDCSNPSSVSCVDLWCGPGVGFAAHVAAPTDCVNGPTSAMTHTHRERFSPESFGVVGSYRHVPLPSSRNFAGMMLLQGNLLMGARFSHDYFRDWRLDVDNMSYEQLLELGERIGYVNTGLTEDEMRRYIMKFKRSKFDQTSKRQVDKKCSICQEEFEADDDLGRLSCKHEYHFQCLRQWLAQKNSCPVCQQEVVRRHSHSVAKS